MKFVVAGGGQLIISAIPAAGGARCSRGNGFGGLIQRGRSEQQDYFDKLNAVPAAPCAALESSSGLRKSSRLCKN